ncbi:hypothetical protein C8A03DRAFT_32811 [Achaetomium macrosporum]|uniref:Uncharacterized protein n=1 Tax=Achaetomium macrosporum TaxID=79813 RepID=A0AAN7CBY8_9PEZI|nr:hypothetical protein C8A03DRAFT_32811 [Achaetomium macrosporum]
MSVSKFKEAPTSDAPRSHKPEEEGTASNICCDACRKGPKFVSAATTVLVPPTDYQQLLYTPMSHLVGDVPARAQEIYRLGLASWDDLSASTKQRMLTWSPVARELWESDFVMHREALVRAWIWHYLDDTLFTGRTDNPVKCSCEAWEHLRALRLELDCYLYGMMGEYQFMLRPLGTDQAYGFPVDEEWMTLDGTGVIPYSRPGQEIPPVQLVSDPMLVCRGLDRFSFREDFVLWHPMSRMRVVAPWTFGGQEAESVGLTGYPYDTFWHSRLQRLLEQEKKGASKDTDEKKRSGACTGDGEKDGEQGDASDHVEEDEHEGTGGGVAVGDEEDGGDQEDADDDVDEDSHYEQPDEEEDTEDEKLARKRKARKLSRT